MTNIHPALPSHFSTNLPPFNGYLTPVMCSGMKLVGIDGMTWDAADDAISICSYNISGICNLIKINDNASMSQLQFEKEDKDDIVPCFSIFLYCNLY